MSGVSTARCDDCGSQLDRGQRYCVDCGARIGARSPQLTQLLHNLRDAQVAETQPARPVQPAAAGASRAARAPGLTLPAPRVSAVLVLMFLGFGVLIGGAAGPRVSDTLASSSSPLRIVLPQATASAAGTATEPSAAPPISESTPTPAAPAAASPEAPSSPLPAAKPAPAASAPTSSSSEGGQSGSPSAGSPSQGSPPKRPPVKHVFVITLSDEPFASLFGPASGAPYLSQTLERRGELLVRYYAVAHEGLADGVALLSGQGPTAETAVDCPKYSNIEAAAVGADQQVSGSGCVYPSSTRTVAGQLAEKHLGWRAYVEGMDESGAAGGGCAHPVLGQPDPTASAPLPAGQTYATFRNPFVYFHSVIDSRTCAGDDVGLRQLGGDLSGRAHAPSFSYIVPDGCHDGSPTPCAPGAPSGPAAADGFLEKVVPEITSSAAYKDGGLLVITADEAPSSGPFADSSSCCGQPQFPNLPAPTAATVKGLPSKGGGEVGALLLSSYVKPGTTNQEQYNHFSLLRTIEDLFGLKHLGYAGRPGVSSFNASVFSAYKSG